MTPDQKKYLVIGIGLALEIGITVAAVREAKKNHKSTVGTVIYGAAGLFTAAAITGILLKATKVKV